MPTASTSKATPNLEAVTSQTEQNAASSSAASGDLQSKGEAKTKKTPKRKSKSEQKEEPIKPKNHRVETSKVIEYIFSDDDDDLMGDNDFNPDTHDSEPSFPQVKILLKLCLKFKVMHILVLMFERNNDHYVIYINERRHRRLHLRRTLAVLPRRLSRIRC